MNMTTQITRENFTRAMREAVAERGAGFVYPEQGSELAKQGWRSGGVTCVYALPSGEPGCLIGLALHKIDPELLESVRSSLVPAQQVLQHMLGVQDYALAYAAREAQEAQDSGKTWGEALAKFKWLLAMLDDGHPARKGEEW